MPLPTILETTNAVALTKPNCRRRVGVERRTEAVVNNLLSVYTAAQLLRLTPKPIINRGQENILFFVRSKLRGG